MPMFCPQCKTPSFDNFQPEPELDVLRCATCRGMFVASARYFAFLAASSSDGIPEVSGTPLPVSDSRELKLCPACSKFMRYYPVGQGIPFGIDKCNTCGGVWLSDGEWDELRRRNLHRKLHAISSDVWQERVQRDQRAAADRAAMLRRLGAEDLAKLESLSAWVQHHPHAAEIVAYLQHAVPSRG